LGTLIAIEITIPAFRSIPEFPGKDLFPLSTTALKDEIPANLEYLTTRGVSQASILLVEILTFP
jgi:hypothetical protein